MPNIVLSVRAVSKGQFGPEPGKPVFLEVLETGRSKRWPITNVGRSRGWNEFGMLPTANSAGGFSSRVFARVLMLLGGIVRNFLLTHERAGFRAGAARCDVNLDGQVAAKHSMNPDFHGG